jgi:hypothetical protein
MDIDSPSRLSLRGSVNPLRQKTGFLLPVFTAGNDHWLQDIVTNGNVTAFSRFDDPEAIEALLPPGATSHQAFGLGDPVYHAFLLPTGAIVAGTQDKVAQTLSAAVAELQPYPFVRLEVLRFLQCLDDVGSTIQQGEERLFLTNPALAKSWAQRERHTFRNDEAEVWARHLQLNGRFYPDFVAGNREYSQDLKCAIWRTVHRLLETTTTSQRPGMLLGKIQSGKTRTFMGVIALAFDQGFEVAVVLTKGTVALATQTLQRLRHEYAQFIQHDDLDVYDIMSMPSNLNRWELRKKLVFVVKKEDDNMKRLETALFASWPELSGRKVLIIDDEADYASVGFRRSKTEGVQLAKIAGQLDSIRSRLADCSFLQVTATPYSLYLQPQDMTLRPDMVFKPIRPTFTELVPVAPAYIGGDYYFDESERSESVASGLFHAVGEEELGVLRQSDGRKFKLENALTSKAITALRAAFVNFIVGGCIRQIQEKQRKASEQKYSFLVHTEAQRGPHRWQAEIVEALKSQLTEALTADSSTADMLLRAAFDDLARSMNCTHVFVPPYELVREKAASALLDDHLVISIVNSNVQVRELLDDRGQLKLRTPLNLFIGGQILDRGLTIANLIGFYYGRNPQTMQQDTVLQHSRMFGFRPIEDLAVTRFYTTPKIYAAMQRMHEIDSALRDSIEEGGDRGVYFIRKDPSGMIRPCSPNKILLSTTTTLRPYTRLLPVGFQTGYKTHIAKTVQRIDTVLRTNGGDPLPAAPFLISMETAVSLIADAYSTMEFDPFYEWDLDAARAAIQHLSNQCETPVRRGQVWCIVRTGRTMKRLREEGRFSNAPDTYHEEGEVARDKAEDIPALLMIKQEGLEKDGWRGTPFYWPVIMAQRDTRTSVFASDVQAD